MSDDTMVNRRDFLGAAAFGMAASLARSPFAGSTLAGERWLGAPDPMRDVTARVLGDEGPFPDLGGAVGWINTAPLTSKSLRGKVVLADIWTYSCINSIRPMPYLKSWAAKYKEAGLVIIGIHSPEFEFEKDRANVEKAVRDMKITYPVAIDSNHGVWQAFNNQYWPADYFIDGKGRIRHHHFGEGDYEASERVLQQLLEENGAAGLDGSLVNISGSGIEAPPDLKDARSPETYVGFNRGENFVSPERFTRDSRMSYSVPAKLSLNQWALAGSWIVGDEKATSQEASGKIAFRFHSRDLNLVLGAASAGKPVRFRVKIDGTVPGDDHGSDVEANGSGEIHEPRLYQLIRQKDPVADRTFEIEFLDPGAQGYVVTFG